jgi:hypothetical protein
MEYFKVRSIRSLLVVAIIAGTSPVSTVEATSALFYTSIVAIVQFLNNWYIGCFTSFDEAYVGIRNVTLEADFKWPIAIGRGIPGFVALIEPSIRLWRIEMCALPVTRIRNCSFK